MGFQRFESRFCTFEAPDGWRIVAGLAAVDGRDEARQRSAVVVENWVDTPQDAATFLDRQLEVMTQVESEIELVEKRNLDSRNLGEALLATFRMPLPDGRALLQKQLIAVEGRLACTLTVSGLEDDRELWNECCNPILGSFDVSAREWSGEIRESDDVVNVDADGPPPSMHDVSGLGLAIPVPAGWEVAPDGTLRRGESAKISIRRTGLPAASAEECFAEALERFSRAGEAKPNAWKRGETPGGTSFWSVDAVSTRQKTWGPPDRHLRREVFVDDNGVLAFTLDCTGEPAGPVEDLGRIVGGYRWLNSDRQTLRLGEPWLQAELAGRWTAPGPGVYIRSDPPQTMVLVQQLGKEATLADLVKHHVDATRRAPEVVHVEAETRDDSHFRGCDAVRYLLDFTDAEGQKVSLRTCWLDTPKTRCVVNVRAAASDTADEILRTLMDGFSPEAASGTGDDGGAT